MFDKFPTCYNLCNVPGDQLNMAVFFWYLGESDLSSVRHCSHVHWTSHFNPGTIKSGPGLTGPPVCTCESLGSERNESVSIPAYFPENFAGNFSADFADFCSDSLIFHAFIALKQEGFHKKL